MCAGDCRAAMQAVICAGGVRNYAGCEVAGGGKAAMQAVICAGL